LLQLRLSESANLNQSRAGCDARAERSPEEEENRVGLKRMFSGHVDHDGILGGLRDYEYEFKGEYGVSKHRADAVEGDRSEAAAT